jgi:hypothetical protein
MCHKNVLHVKQLPSHRQKSQELHLTLKLAHSSSQYADYALGAYDSCPEPTGHLSQMLEKE